MIINREHYVKELLSKRWNGKVKIITGIRRCGKSFLLSTLYKDYLKAETCLGVFPYTFTPFYT